MKIHVKVGLYGPGAVALSADPSLRSEVDFGETVLWLDQESSILERILCTAAKGPGLNLGFEVSFSEREVAQATRLEPIPRRTLRLPDEDLTALAKVVSNTPIRDAGGLFGKVRVIESLSLSTVKTAPDQIAMIDDSFPEYVIGAHVLGQLQDSGMTGWRTIPITTSGTARTHPAATLLSSTSFSGPAAPDPTVWRCEDGSTGQAWYWCLGCKVFPPSSLQHLPDFARSAEPLEVHAFPFWIVSSRVRELFKKISLRDWRWRPVLERDSALHRRYSEAWQPLLDLIRLNPKNHLG
jgi:hypothetical protein